MLRLIGSDNIPEIVANAFRTALTPYSGACFISLPQDVLSDSTDCKPIPGIAAPEYGEAPKELIAQAAALINQAKQPVILLGMEASRQNNAKAIRALLKKHPFALIGIYQAAGVVSKEYVDLFMGRWGLFKNQPGDQLLDIADVVLTIGYNPVEYDPEIWNATNKKR